MSFRKFPELIEAWQTEGDSAKLRSLRQAAARVREYFVDDGACLAVKTSKLITFPYPTVFAFSGAALSPAPYVMMTNRMMVVQFEEISDEGSDDDGRLRTLLFNPSDFERGGTAAPFYRDLAERYGTLSRKVLSKTHGTVQSELATLGLRPDDVDYIAYDHLHIQDVRGWLGSYGEPAYFPRAKLLIMREEWELVRDLHPLQTPWYVPGGTDGIPDARVVLLENDAWLGRGVALVKTPGHTSGNMSLLVNADGATFVTSENGVATESYSPASSSIPGLGAFAKRMGAEVVLNGNTRERTLDQYGSMIVEKTLAGPNEGNPEFVNFLPSSELTSSFLAPGLAPTFSLEDIDTGKITRAED